MSPRYLRRGGTVGSIAGPAAPMMTDQKMAGRSRAAQRQYRRGVDQKCGAADIVSVCAVAVGRVFVVSETVESSWIGREIERNGGRLEGFEGPIGSLERVNGRRRGCVHT